MDTRLFGLLSVCLFMTFGLSHGTVSVSVDLSAERGNPGDNITCLCRLTGGDMATVVYMFKEIRKDNGDTVQELVSTGDVLAPLYGFMNRFRMDKSDAGSAILIVLHITNVTVNDSGHYGCYVHGQSDSYQSERLEIYKQPVEVRFTNYTKGDIIVFEENQPMELECYVEGVVPSPVVKILLAGVNHEEEFQKRTHLKTMCEGSFGQKENCPLHFTYDVSLYHPEFLPQKISDNDQISCQTYISDARHKPMVTTHTIRYRYSPVFNCEATQYAALHQNHYHLECVVSYNPDAWEFVWTFTIDGSEHELVPGRGYEYEEFTVEKTEVNETSSKISLIIKEVMDKHYTAYQLTVYQELGNKTMDFLLQELEETPAPAGASAVMSSIFVFIFTSLISTVLS